MSSHDIRKAYRYLQVCRQASFVSFKFPRDSILNSVLDKLLQDSRLHSVLDKRQMIIALDGKD